MARSEPTFTWAEASSEELEKRLPAVLDRLDVPAVRQILANPHCTEKVTRWLYDESRLRAVYEVRRDLARHRRTHLTLALQLISGLFWRDLLEVGRDARLRPQVRRAAELRLQERLPGLAQGEKLSIARKASVGLMQVLRHDPSPRVISGLLENPRLTEGILLPLLASETARPQVLAVIADSRWGHRYPVRSAICKNPRTPVAKCLSLLPLLKKHDLVAMTRDPRLSTAVRRRAALLSGAGG